LVVLVERKELVGDDESIGRTKAMSIRTRAFIIMGDIASTKCPLLAGSGPFHTWKFQILDLLALVYCRLRT